jgi:ERCC4-type nuclease
MILLTTAVNDKDLVKPLGGMAIRVPIKHGDMMWESCPGWHRPEAVDLSYTAIGKVTVERKHIPDLMDCIDDGRHLQQVRAAHEAGFHFYILVVEDTWREARDGTVEYQRKGKWRTHGNIQFSRVDAYLNELHYLMGVHVKHTRTVKQTARVVLDLYRMFQTPPDEHSSLKKFYTPPTPTMLMAKPSLLRRVAKELKHISWERSIEVEKEFSGVRDMVNAGAERWAKLDGFGEVIVESVQKELE